MASFPNLPLFTWSGCDLAVIWLWSGCDLVVAWLWPVHNGLGHNPKHNCYKQKIASPATHVAHILASKVSIFWACKLLRDGLDLGVQWVSEATKIGNQPAHKQPPEKAMLGFRQCKWWRKRVQMLSKVPHAPMCLCRKKWRRKACLATIVARRSRTIVVSRTVSAYQWDRAACWIKQ